MNEFIHSFSTDDSLKIKSSFNKVEYFWKQTNSMVKKFFLPKDTLFNIVEDLLISYQTIINHAFSLKQIYLLTPDQQKPEHEQLWDSIVRLMQEIDFKARTNLYLWQNNVAKKYGIIL